MKSLTIRQEAILTFLSKYTSQYGHSPSYREIGRGTSISSTSIIFMDLNKLEERGYITKKKTFPRAISLVKQIPYLTVRSIPYTSELKISINTDSPEIIGLFSETFSTIP